MTVVYIVHNSFAMAVFCLIVSLILIFYAEGCKEIHPVVVKESSKFREKTIELKYDGVLEFSYFAVSVVGNSDCSIQRNVNNINQIFIDYAGSCQINFSIANGTLNTIISLIKDVNIVNVSTKGCGHSKDKINDKRIFINKRWLQSNGQHIGDRHLGNGLLVILLISCGLLLTLVFSVFSVFMSCCVSKPSHHDIEAAGLTDSINRSSVTQSPEILQGLHPPPGTPQEVIRISSSMSPLPPDYVSPHLLNIPVPDVPPSTPPRSSRMMQMTTENTAERYSTAHEVEHHYQILEPSQTFEDATCLDFSSRTAEHHYQILEPLQDVQDDSTCLDHGSRTIEHHYQILEPPTSNQDSSNLDDGNRTYFVLDVAKQDLSTEFSQTSPENRIYHVLEPSSSDTCTICKRSLQQEQEPLYLVVLPEESKAIATKDEPLYQVLEQPSLICQSCLCFEDDPIYNEVEANDVGYAVVKSMIRQSSSVSNSSHTYSTVPSIDYNDADKTSSIMKHSSSDYAVIPDTSEHNTPPGQFLEEPDTIKKQRHGSISNLISLFKDKLIHQVRQAQDKNKDKLPTISNTKEDNDDLKPIPNHTYENTGPGVDTAITLGQVQIKLNGMAKESSSPIRTLVRSKSHNDYTPLIIAQRKKSGSYHVLNVEDIWKHQLANRYAPVSIIKKRNPPSPTKLRTSLRSRRSYLCDTLMSKNPSSEYEEPIKLHPKPTGKINIKPKTNFSQTPHADLIKSRYSPFKYVIPPPHVLRTRLSRQDAVNNTYYFDESEEPSVVNRLYAINSEPCLSLSDDYDHIASQPTSPLKQQHPLERSMSSCTSTPVKLPFKEKSISLRHHSLSCDDDDDYYDHTWDS